MFAPTKTLWFGSYSLWGMLTNICNSVELPTHCTWYVEPHFTTISACLNCIANESCINIESLAGRRRGAGEGVVVRGWGGGAVVDHYRANQGLANKPPHAIGQTGALVLTHSTLYTASYVRGLGLLATRCFRLLEDIEPLTLLQSQFFNITGYTNKNLVHNSYCWLYPSWMCILSSLFSIYIHLHTDGTLLTLLMLCVGVRFKNVSGFWSLEILILVSPCTLCKCRILSEPYISVHITILKLWRHILIGIFRM